MSVIHHLQIVPKNPTHKTLQEFNAFTTILLESGLIEQEFTILTGEKENIKNISIWDFKSLSVTSDLTSGNKLQIIGNKDIENLAEKDNYAFKFHLTKKNSTLSNLEIFDSTDLEHYPIFISLFSHPIDFIVSKEDEETEEYEEVTINEINFVIQSSGRNSESLWGLVENQEEYKIFFDILKQFIGDIETGTFYG